MYTEVIFDLETQKFFDEIEGFDPSNLGVSVLSLYVRTLDKDFKEIKGEMVSFLRMKFLNLGNTLKMQIELLVFNSKNLIFLL